MKSIKIIVLGTLTKATSQVSTCGHLATARGIKYGCPYLVSRLCQQLKDQFVTENGRKLFLLYIRPLINGIGNYYKERKQGVLFIVLPATRLSSSKKIYDYAFDEINEIIPITINIGNAMYINPPTTIPINTKGNNTTVTKNFDIPQAALIPNNNILPNTHIMQIVNISDNIFLPPLVLMLNYYISSAFH